jgi:hypothetical protein
MRRIAERFGIVWDPMLRVPTFNSRPVRANSSDPVAQYGVLKNRTDAYREVLDAAAIARVDELAGDLYGQIGGWTRRMAKTTLNRGTLEELRARTSSRREAARGRDDMRFRLAAELGERSRFSILDEKGYLILSPGSIAEAGPVVEAGNALVDSIGHDRLLAEFNPRHDTMSRGFLPPESHELGSPYMNFALHDDVVGTASAYLDVVPILLNIDIWYAYAPRARRGRSTRRSGTSTATTRRRSRSGSICDAVLVPVRERPPEGAVPAPRNVELAGGRVARARGTLGLR